LKRLLILIAVIALIAVFQGPAGAGAATLSQPKGTPLREWTTVSARSTNTTIATPIGTEKCKEVVLKGAVIWNSGGVVALEGIGPGYSYANGCTFAGSPTLHTVELEYLELEEEAGEVIFEYSFLTGGGWVPEHVEASVSWESGGSTVNLTGSLVGALPGQFEGDFELTAGGVPVTVE
jgi:hypothetical protein